MGVNMSIDFYLVGTQEIVNDIAYIYKVMEMVDARKIEANKEKNEQQQKPTQLKLLFRFVLEKGDETENFLRKKPDGNESIDCFSNFTHTFWFIMVKWTKKTWIDSTWISEATT